MGKDSRISYSYFFSLEMLGIVGEATAVALASILMRNTTLTEIRSAIRAVATVRYNHKWTCSFAKNGMRGVDWAPIMAQNKSLHILKYEMHYAPVRVCACMELLKVHL
jgi:hypothetical protein